MQPKNLLPERRQVIAVSSVTEGDGLGLFNEGGENVSELVHGAVGRLELLVWVKGVFPVRSELNILVSALVLEEESLVSIKTFSNF